VESPNSKPKFKYNVSKFVFKYHPNAKIASGGREAILFCMWHNSDKRKLYINLVSGVFNCFSCGTKGNFYKFVQKTLETQNLQTSIRDIFSSLQESDTLEQEIKSEINQNSIIIDYPEYSYSLSEKDKLGYLGNKALEYLYSRNVTDEQIAYYRLRYSLAGPYANRILIPVFNNENDLVSFVARDFTGQLQPKVLTPSGNGTEGIKRYVFNLNNARFTRTYYIGEGVFDAMALGIHGIALFGKIPTDIQLNTIILSKPFNVYCCLDADAEYENEKLAYALAFHCENVYIVRWPMGDPSSLPHEQVEESIKSAEKFTQWMSVPIF
jgi:DNA primase